MLRRQLLDTSRGRVVALLQRGALTVDEIANHLGVTHNAVRAQLIAMERDGVVRKAGQRPGTTRPFQVYELTVEIEQLLSQAYVPLLTQLVQVFANALPPREVAALMRQAGKGLAHQLPLAKKSAATLEARVSNASEFLNTQLGAVTHIESNGEYRIRGAGCPLAALTGKHPAVCLAMESLLSEVLGTAVRECCDRTAKPRCCFIVKKDDQHTDRPARRRRRR
jgi:predicted ArsR family transcriptional regulator